MQTQDADARVLMKNALDEINRLRAELAERTEQNNEPIAIVGMGCRFPGGVANPTQFWQQLSQTASAETEVPAARWDIAGYYHPDRSMPGKMDTRYGCFLEQIDQFDPAFLT